MPPALTFLPTLPALPALPALVFILGLLVVPQKSAGDFTTKPNIIFLLTDDQGSADVKFSNPMSPFVTDNIDGLAAESVRLANYYVHPTCSPTRAALMTGRYAANVGLSMAMVPSNPGGLDPRYQTIAEHLAGEGYQNYLVGKWHLGMSMLKHHPLNRGFHQFYGLLGGGFNHYTKQQGNGRYDFWRNFDPVYDNTTHATQLFNAEALKIVRQHVGDAERKKPFFLYLSHPAPHDPLMAPKEHEALCQHIPNRRRRLSCAMVAGIDEGLGQILQVLKEANQLENTVIAFSTDNGGVPYAGALNYPLRGAKTTVFEGGVKAPGFIYAPKLLGRNRDFKGLFHVTDFLPTFSAMINSTARIVDYDSLDGLNQLESLIKGADTLSEGARQSIHIHRDIDRDSHAYRRGPWKLIVGHHYLPFPFSRIYNETTSDWMVEDGDIWDVLLHCLLAGMDVLFGTENSISVQYVSWMLIGSRHVGGLKNAFNTGNASTGLFVQPYQSNLAFWRAHHTPDYPTVSLFNVEADPSEQVNLADSHPDLVETLLEEAESTVQNAPPMIRGDMAYTKAPVGPQAGLRAILTFLGTNHKDIVPFGPFLADDFDLSSQEDQFHPWINQLRMQALAAYFAMFCVFVLLPIIMMWLSCRLLYKLV